MLKALTLAATLMLSAPALATECIFPKDVAANARQWLETGFATGTILATVDAKGNGCYLKLGVLETGSKQTVGENTIFEIGSISKVFTALTLARLIEQGKVKLTDSYRELLPEVAMPQGANREITLADLATHTSGLPRMPTNFTPVDMGNPYVDYTSTQLFEFLRQYKLPRLVGSTYEYSNLGFGLLGLGLSRKYGKDYESMVQEQVIQPLGLRDTGINLARNQLIRFAGAHAGTSPVTHWDLPSLAGAGALRSSAADLVSFVSAAMGARTSPLDKAFALTEQARIDAGVQNVKVGLAWHRLSVGKQELVFHDGGTGGFLSFIGFDPASKQGVVVLANSSTYPVNAMAMHMLAPSLPLPTAHKVIKLSQEQLEKLTGNYEFKAIGLKAVVSRAEDQLIAGFVGQGKLVLHAETPNHFYLTEVEATLDFTTDAQGHVTGIKLNQGGQTFLGERVK